MYLNLEAPVSYFTAFPRSLPPVPLSCVCVCVCVWLLECQCRHQRIRQNEGSGGGWISDIQTHTLKHAYTHTRAHTHTHTLLQLSYHALATPTDCSISPPVSPRLPAVATDTACENVDNGCGQSAEGRRQHLQVKMPQLRTPLDAPENTFSCVKNTATSYADSKNYSWKTWGLQNTCSCIRACLNPSQLSSFHMLWRKHYSIGSLSSHLPSTFISISDPASCYEQSRCCLILCTSARLILRLHTPPVPICVPDLTHIFRCINYTGAHALVSELVSGRERLEFIGLRTRD